MAPSRPQLTGTLYKFPFQAGRIGAASAPLYRDLIREYESDDILVLKRFPTGIQAIERAYADAIDSVAEPSILGLSAHANRVIADLDDPPTLLDQSERNLLVASFVQDHTWTDSYLARAATNESFVADVGRFITEATWQGGNIETDDPALQELVAANSGFHGWLASEDQLDPTRSLRFAVDALSNERQRTAIQTEFDAVLALEFEEFTGIDREYLAWLTLGVPLYCVAETDSAIQRTWNEPGKISEYVPELESRSLPGSHEEQQTAPAAVASYLATDETSKEPSSAKGSVEVIEAETFSDEIAAVAEEIERLRRTTALQYDDMAVVLRDSNAPIPDALRGLRAAGVPVASATVGGLEHDPAARELYALVSWCYRTTEHTPSADAHRDTAPGWSTDRARGVLEARVGAHDREGTPLDPILDTVIERADTFGLADAVNYWLIATDLKHRIGSQETPFDAKVQFGHVRTLRQLIGSVDSSPLLTADWETLCVGFEEELQRASTDKITTGLDLPDGGVLVDAVRVVKNEQRPVVFMVDVIDREYPADPQFTSLFPTPHLEELDGYPAFTTPSAADVTSTFGPSTDPTRPLHAYYAALSRRLLAVGARCASDRLYFSLHRDDATGTGSRQQPSRFLADLEGTFGELPRVEHDGIYSHGEAVRFALTRMDDALDRVRQAGLVTDPINMHEVEAEFEAVQRILDADPPGDLAPALEARLDFAAGGVRRE